MSDPVLEIMSGSRNRVIGRKDGYFTEYSIQKGLFYLIASVYVMAILIIVIIEPWLNLCTPILSERFENPAYDDSPCRKGKMQTIGQNNTCENLTNLFYL